MEAGHTENPPREMMERVCRVTMENSAGDGGESVRGARRQGSYGPWGGTVSHGRAHCGYGRISTRLLGADGSAVPSWDLEAAELQSTQTQVDLAAGPGQAVE